MARHTDGYWPEYWTMGVALAEKFYPEIMINLYQCPEKRIFGTREDGTLFQITLLPDDYVEFLKVKEIP